MKFKWLFIILIIGVSGCSSFGKMPSPPTIEVRARILCPSPPKADRLVMLPVSPEVYLNEEKEWVRMTMEDYANLGENMQRILSHIKQRRGIIRFYENCVAAAVKEDNRAESDSDSL